MNAVTSTLSLLAALAKLLAFVAANPSLPPEITSNAVAISQKAIVLAQNTLAEQTLRNAAANGDFRIVPQPIYDLYTLERTIHAMINDERKQRGLTPLELDETLSRVARRHSEDQAATNRLTTDIQKPCAYPMIRHEGLTDAGFDLGERLDSAAVKFRRAAENIAVLSSAKNSVYRAPASITCPNLSPQEVPKTGTEQEKQAVVRANIARAQNVLATIPTVRWVNRDWYDLDTIARRAVTGWMESEGHRANILNEHYRQTGIGASEANGYIIITQLLLEPTQ
jgi:uncharacterized protein YkwD